MGGDLAAEAAKATAFNGAIPPMHVDFAPLVGVTNESPAAKLYLVIGYEL